jgi:hypothetical protein
MMDLLRPDRTKFDQNPAGYAALAWKRWANLQDMHGVQIDPERPPSPEDLKSPVLWLTQAQALTQAAVTLYRAQPSFETMPVELRAICDSQYCAVLLMLVGYSLEVALKAMTIMRLGVDEFMRREKKLRIHRLSDLADFIPNLSEKDHAILKVLTHFVIWAGRYPDPGTKQHADQEDVFKLSETFQISARDLFQLASRVMDHVRTLVPAE